MERNIQTKPQLSRAQRAFFCQNWLKASITSCYSRCGHLYHGSSVEQEAARLKRSTEQNLIQKSLPPAADVIIKKTEPALLTVRMVWAGSAPVWTARGGACCCAYRENWWFE